MTKFLFIAFLLLVRRHLFCPWKYLLFRCPFQCAVRAVPQVPERLTGKGNLSAALTVSHVLKGRLVTKLVRKLIQLFSFSLSVFYNIKHEKLLTPCFPNAVSLTHDPVCFKLICTFPLFPFLSFPFLSPLLFFLSQVPFTVSVVHLSSGPMLNELLASLASWTFFPLVKPWALLWLQQLFLVPLWQQLYLWCLFVTDKHLWWEHSNVM